MTGIRVSLAGASLWAPGVDGRADGADLDISLLHPRLRRRTSFLTRMAVAVFTEAVAQAGADKQALAIVFGSVFGEIVTTYDLLVQLAEGTDESLSPIKFHNSVHNTAPGYLSIACQNREINTAITAGWSTVAMGVVEAATLLQVHQSLEHVAVVVAEESLPKQLAFAGRYASLAAAFVFSRARSDGPTWELVRRQACPSRGEVPPNYEHNPCSPAITLHRALAEGRGDVSLERGDGPGWMLIQET